MSVKILEVKKFPKKNLDPSTYWQINFSDDDEKITDKITGWTGSGDTMSQVHLTFATLAQATSHLDELAIKYEIVPLGGAAQPKIVKKSYLDIYRKD